MPARDFEERLQNVVDEYAGGISVQSGYAEGTLRSARLHVVRLEQELEALGAATPYELMHCHEVIDRVEVALGVLVSSRLVATFGAGDVAA